jgi:hypothetical protein
LFLNIQTPTILGTNGAQKIVQPFDICFCVMCVLTKKRKGQYSYTFLPILTFY